MRLTRAPWSIALIAVLLNAFGSPMAWAQWLDSAGTADPTPSSCHGHEAPAADEAGMPCCVGGDCLCAVPALFVYRSSIAARIPHPAFLAPFDTSALPPHPLDDTLRPPIA